MFMWWLGRQQTHFQVRPKVRESERAQNKVDGRSCKVDVLVVELVAGRASPRLDEKTVRRKQDRERERETEMLTKTFWPPKASGLYTKNVGM